MHVPVIGVISVSWIKQGLENIYGEKIRKAGGISPQGEKKKFLENCFGTNVWILMKKT